MEKGQRVRFVKPSRYNDWQKGQFGSVDKVLTNRPGNQFDLYVISLSKHKVWATHEDIERFDQLSLF